MKFSLTNIYEVKKFFIIFYVVGTLGMLIPLTSSFFKTLTPYSLLLCFGYLAYFDQNKKNIKAYIVFAIIFLIGFLVEMVGVNTGYIFGHYTYQETLGYSIYNTPVIIGLNWVFLIYTTASVLEQYKIPAILKIILASLMMVIYDLILEQVAPKMKMWYWEDSIVPLRNYGVWFLLAIIFHSLIVIFKVNTKNPLSIIVLVSQFIFFIFLALFLR